MEFKKGDRVISTFHQNRGMRGKVIDNTRYGDYIIEWEDGGNYGSNNHYNGCYLIKAKPITLKELIKE